MTRDQLRDLEVTSPEEFEGILAAVVEKTVEADVDVRSAREFRTEINPRLGNRGPGVGEKSRRRGPAGSR